MSRISQERNEISRSFLRQSIFNARDTASIDVQPGPIKKQSPIPRIRSYKRIIAKNTTLTLLHLISNLHTVRAYEKRHIVHIGGLAYSRIRKKLLRANRWFRVVTTIIINHHKRATSKFLAISDTIARCYILLYLVPLLK